MQVRGNFYFGSGLGFLGFTFFYGYAQGLFVPSYPDIYQMKIVSNSEPKPVQTVIEEDEEDEDDSSDSENVVEIEPVFFTSRVNPVN